MPVPGSLAAMTIVATAVSVTLFIVGVPYPILPGLITGIFNLLPYFGIFAGIVLSATPPGTSADSTAVIYVFITFLVTHVLDRNIILPLVVGSKVRINALVTVLGVVIGEMRRAEIQIKWLFY
ncbi:AI-2E family transporter [Mucilaginibacter gotjawali]|uniref:PurR-regulated permease PerM n=2 Tax=Mucilaginibacter gotjawali TaxID=1550579 RepID=A0A839SJX9_9SPHI|nr:AI-2E family transporter [Mucilaginibacter gotjawali]MBB3057752.1 putative PurR-regulated permease PerM [Mucilaginibacter gotjawali]BAU52554.1 hypothetical protein MgSA37_00716 [Mucilaginibacter gotjawali]